MNNSTANKWGKTTRTSQGIVYGSPMDNNRVNLREDLEFTEKKSRIPAVIAVGSLGTSFWWLPLLVRSVQEVMVNSGLQTFAGQVHNYLAVFK